MSVLVIPTTVRPFCASSSTHSTDGDPADDGGDWLTGLETTVSVGVAESGDWMASFVTAVSAGVANGGDWLAFFVAAVSVGVVDGDNWLTALARAVSDDSNGGDWPTPAAWTASGGVIVAVPKPRMSGDGTQVMKASCLPLPTAVFV